MESQKISIPSSELFKVCLLDSKGLVRTAYVFGGGFIDEATANVNEFFSDIEVAEFRLNNTEIIYSKQQIHKDDSIRILKKKVVHEIGIDKVSYNELYFFSTIVEKIRFYSAFQEMTVNETIPMDHNMLGQLLLNINVDDHLIDKIEKKDTYSYDDVLKIINPEIEYEINISIGQRFANTRNLLFSANPFQLIPVDNLYKETAHNPRINFENQLLLNHGDLKGNTLYLCLAPDIFDYVEKLGIDPQYVSDIYFPLLSKLGIINKSQWLENRAAVIKDNKKIIKVDTMKLYETVDLFYNMFHSKTVELPYLNKGIMGFHIVIHPEAKTVLPLDSIFKNIHATMDIPFIKYNAGSRKENIYRLYSEKVSRTGKKIPFLPKNLIMNLSKITGKGRQISLFLQKVVESVKYNIFINFEHNGNISIQCELKEPLTKEALEKLLFDSITPVISKINSYLEQTGYQLNTFHRLTDDLLEIVSMKYVTTITMEKKIDLSQHYGCLTSIFNIVEENLSKGAILEYKRVENYQKMDSIANTITEAYNNTYNEGAIINIIMKKYNMSMEESSMQLAKYLNEHTRIQGKYANKMIDIAENPGFISLFHVFPFENKLVIEIDKINNIAYLDILAIYLDSFLRMSQMPETSGIAVDKIKRTCKKSIAVDDTSHVSNVIAPAVLLPIAPVAFAKVTKFPGFDEEEEEGEGEDGDIDFSNGVDEEEGFEFSDEVEDGDEEDGEDGDGDGEEVKENITLEKKVDDSPVKLMANPAPTVGVPDLSVSPVIIVKKTMAPATAVETSLPPSVAAEQPSLLPPMVEQTSLPPPVAEEQPSLTPSVVDHTVLPVEELPSTEAPLKDQTVEPFSEEEDEGFEFEDYDDEEEEDSASLNSASLMKGGTKYDDKRELFDNKPFKKKKIFLDKMVKKEPKLFLAKDQGNYASYSRVCPTNVNLQPVLLTPKEKERIDKEFPGSYGKALEYGSDPKNKNYYICPRYWCLLSNSSMSHEDVIAGKCGKIIPKEDESGKPLTKIPPGHYVYEFTDDKYHKDDQGNYREHFPGFKPNHAHPDGLCIPCCYNNWDSEARKKRREQCLNPSKKVEGDEGEGEDEVDMSRKNLYVVGAARYPIPPQRWGFLPPSVEAFFQIDHMRVVTKNNPALILENRPVLLRYGVEQSMKQSFIGCLADAYAYKKQIAVPTIKEMRTLLVKAVTLDMFLRYHNGSLVSIFQPKKSEIAEEILSKYKETIFYKSIDQANESQMDFLEDTVASFENFLLFLQDDNAVIDHTYLWDIITSPNETLFSGGINLVVIEIVDNDITDNIKVLCPTNSYSKKFYDTTKETLIVLKRDEFYDPIYLYEYKGEEEIKATKLFYKDVSIKNVKRVLEIIQSSSNKYCAPLSSMPKVYKFERSLPLLKLRELLRENDYVISSQVMNYQGKIIGVIIKETEEQKKGIYVPCFPSPAVESTDLPLEFMENDIWSDYRTTRDALIKVYKVSSRKIPCNPVIKVLENNLVVGFLTLTNQFIQVTPPSENIEEDGIEVLKSSNYIVADRVLTTSHKEDEQRIEVTKNIYLESQFYLAFRSTIRILLNQYSNKEKREYLVKLVASTRYLYKEKLKKVEEFLRVLGKKHITFQDFDKKVLYELHEISTCTSDCAEKKYCVMKKEGECNLIIPKKHLVSGVDNEVVYFARMADELLRYNRIRLFMFETKNYLNITSLTYKLNPNEFIILESLLTNDYFNDLIPFQMNSYVRNITYELSKPDVTQKYQDVVPLAEQMDTVVEDTDEFAVQCIRKISEVYGNSSNIWRKRLPRMKAGKEIKEIYFNESNNCSFYVIIQLLKMKLGGEIDLKTGFSIANIKETLLNAYKPYLSAHNLKIFDILKHQGKKEIITKVERGLTAFETILMSEEYYLTDLDIWVLATKLNLPIVLFSLDVFKTMMTKINWLVLAGDIDTNAFYFIRSPKALKMNTAPHYSLIDTPLKLFEVKGMDSIIQNMTSGAKDYSEHFISFDSFIKNYEIVRP